MCCHSESALEANQSSREIDDIGNDGGWEEWVFITERKEVIERRKAIMKKKEKREFARRDEEEEEEEELNVDYGGSAKEVDGMRPIGKSAGHAGESVGGSLRHSTEVLIEDYRDNRHGFEQFFFFFFQFNNA